MLFITWSVYLYIIHTAGGEVNTTFINTGGYLPTPKEVHGVCKTYTWDLQSLRMGFAKLADGVCEACRWDVFPSRNAKLRPIER